MPTRTPGQKASGDGHEKHVPFRERLACSISDAEAASGISRASLYLEMKAGRLDFFKRGSRRFIHVPSLLQLIDSS
jgi:hypothetical protein